MYTILTNDTFERKNPMQEQFEHFTTVQTLRFNETNIVVNVYEKSFDPNRNCV